MCLWRGTCFSIELYIADHSQRCRWSLDALSKGAMDCGYTSFAHGMFPRGSVELVEYFMKSSNEKLNVELDQRQMELEGMSMEERLFVAIQMRLKYLAPVIATWSEVGLYTGEGDDFF